MLALELSINEDKAMEWKILNEKKAFSCCGKMDIVVATEEGFFCMECFSKKYFSPEEVAEMKKEVAILLEGLE